MNREKLAWSVSVLLIAILAFQLPRGMAQRDSDYAFVRTLVDIHRQVTNNYVEPVDESKLENGAINGMLGVLDPFTVYVPPANQEEFDQLLEGSFKGVGIQLNQRDDGKVEVVTPIDGSPAFKAGIQAGDVISKVNGESIDGLRLLDVTKKVKGPLGSPVTLTVYHEYAKEPVDVTMTREEVVVPTLKGYARKPDNTWDYWASDEPKIAYVRMTQFTPETFDKLKDITTNLLKGGMRGMILDLRWNPGGRLDEAVKIVDMFVDKGTIVSVKGRARPERIETATGAGTLPKFPMVVLINEHSASASEVVAGSLKDNKRALIIGTRSYGKGSVQELIPLDGNSGELKMTVAYYYLPSGRLVHRKKDATDWGVEPQIAVPMDEATENQVAKERYEQEFFRRPGPPKVSSTQSTTRPGTQPGAAAAVATTAPTTQAVSDTQLLAAVNSLRSFIIFQNNQGDFTQSAPPTTQPTTKPTGS